jgi:hypothetical protein
MVRRSSSLTELERGAMLDRLAIIEATVQAMVTRFDGMTQTGGKDGGEAE